MTEQQIDACAAEIVEKWQDIEQEGGYAGTVEQSSEAERHAMIQAVGAIIHRHYWNSK